MIFTLFNSLEVYLVAESNKFHLMLAVIIGFLDSHHTDFWASSPPSKLPIFYGR